MGASICSQNSEINKNEFKIQRKKPTTDIQNTNTQDIAVNKYMLRNSIKKIQKAVRNFLKRRKESPEDSILPCLKSLEKLSPLKLSKNYTLDSKINPNSIFLGGDIEALSSQPSRTNFSNFANESKVKVNFPDEKIQPKILCEDPQNKEGLKLVKLKEGNTLLSFFADNKANGYGLLKGADNCLYFGGFIQQKKCGFGMYQNMITKDYCLGNWTDDNQEGVGIEKFNDGSEYVGEFLRGKKHGVGTYIKPNGKKYQGEWVDNQFHGRGIYTFDANKYYIGYFKHSKMHGYGEYFYPNMRYVGFYSNDQREGFGIAHWASCGKIWIGFWKSGKQEGLGKDLQENTSQFGFWLQGKKINHTYTSISQALETLNDRQLRFQKFFIMDYYSILNFINYDLSS